jgi:dinuclear metal center YbgI/SA1388 family protein
MPAVKDIAVVIEELAPPALAEEWDNAGILVDCGEAVEGILVSLDITREVVREAQALGCQLIVSHHPVIFHPLRRVAHGTVLVDMVQQGISAICAHTNLDAAPGGTNDLLAEAAGLRGIRVVEPLHVEQLLKLAVFVPAPHVERVLRALDSAGAGAIGNYSGCTFRARGVGTFRCGEGTKPFQGKPGSFEEADEFRLETVFDESIRDRVVAAMLAAHPYEEVAYELYPLLGGGTTYGLGRAGELPKAETVGALAARLAAATRSTQTQFSGKAGRKVRRAAVWAGGGAPVDLLSACGIEAVILGEIGYHDLETFGDNGVSVISLGHGFSEELALHPLAGRLGELVPGVEFAVAGAGFISMRNVKDVL